MRRSWAPTCTVAPCDSLVVKSGVGCAGPETVVFDKSGDMYAFTERGVVQRILANGSAVDYAYVGGARFVLCCVYVNHLVSGRPLAGDFDSEGNMYVCEASKGLLLIEKNTRRVVVAAARTDDGKPILYADDLGMSHEFASARTVVQTLHPTARSAHSCLHQFSSWTIV